MNTSVRAGLVVASAAVMALASMGTASANHDHGDGTPSCFGGEICFAEHYDGGGGARHFYESWFYHEEQGDFYPTGTTFWHNASSIRNRDTSSPVCVKESGDWTNDTWWFSNDSIWKNFHVDLNDENNSHWRIDEYGGCWT
ncbi:hypothetical protein [Haloechinothrix halophila]|uniref:Peptidase inhibitor family I36 n=1 Tax=Haloechinothrix halophila YIM 93223 TaxID=592678 RepID=W9DSC8_9PSEU|nr:hypothetical protein [Haloechinothrix halophila]ETA66557.1 hypothetical protein AmyhaDRAFT_0317 [Haloechinothrix halophila YIM 93223]